MVDIYLAEKILNDYGISEKVVNITSFQETVFDKQLRCIYQFDLSNKQKVVCRISRESNFSKELIEQQNCFSEKLRNYGILVPKKYCINGHYCIIEKFKNRICNITLEEYVGCDYENIKLSSFYFLGKMLGKMHFISEKDPTEIGYSHISKSIIMGRARFANLYHGIEREIEKLNDIKEIESLHDELVHKVKIILKGLPHGAVHGDLGIFNNIVTMNGKVYIIDFNLAGDEAFLCDMLCCFYSSIYKFAEKKIYIDISEAYSYFIKGYFEYRKFSYIEIENFSIISVLFDGLFYSKSIIKEYNDNRNASVLEKLRCAKDKFDLQNHIFCNDVLRKG